MDEATENLILQLQLEDIEEERDRSKGKARKDDEIADADLALQVQEEEFKHTITIRSDYRMAQSIGRAVTDDAVNIAVLAGEERRAAADREMACRLSGQTARPDPQTSILDTDDDVLSRLSALNIDVATGEESQESSSSPGEAGESSAWATGRRPQRLNGPKNKCDTCMDMKHTVQMPCAHHYCRHCTATPMDQLEFARESIAGARPVFYARNLPMTETARRGTTVLKRRYSWHNPTDGSDASSAKTL
ncbi:MAG: hypothetical protein L6R39_007086 [Caloplaca ligustica]|nr:MAG: hypothetical protein L6R39_007086 [Caloplaca ligustica]